MLDAKRSLGRRITRWAVIYMLLLSVVVIAIGNSINERAERMVWKSSLRMEMDHFDRRRAIDPAYRWRDIEGVSLFGPGSDRPVPPELAHYKPGLHDEVSYGGSDRVLLVRSVGGQHQVLMMDIGEFERNEDRLSVVLLATLALILALLGLAMSWALRRLVRPLSDLANAIRRLRADHGGQRIVPTANASSEMMVIANALNDYLERNDRFVDRERGFIATSSHELRTPIAVITGAAELALDVDSVPDGARRQLDRILHTAQGVEQLIALLLVLARDPVRVAAISDTFNLDQMLPEIVEDHRHLCAGKDLEISIAPLPPCVLHAPASIVRAAIGNLLRNAIENSDRGSIALTLTAPAVVVIEDQGHGMTAEEISAVYARMAREGSADGSRYGEGIGLELIARLCEHLGWNLRIQPQPPQGTRVILDLGTSLLAG